MRSQTERQPPRGEAILIVDDEAGMRDLLAEQVSLAGYRAIVAASGEEAFRLIDSDPPALVITDVHMPGISGLDVTKRIKADPRFRFVPIVIVSGAADLKARVAGLSLGADDFFAKPVEYPELRARLSALLRLKSAIDQLEEAERVILSLAMTVEARDPYTAGHCDRVARLAVLVGRDLGVDEEGLENLRLAGVLHDLGKIAIPDAVLLKQGPLDAGERRKIQEHPVVGAELLKGLRSLEGVRPIIRHHHEKMDGSGYPDGLRGAAVPLPARIMAVVDVYDALTTTRPYRVALDAGKALRILEAETAGGAWDPTVLSALTRVLEREGRSAAPEAAA